MIADGVEFDLAKSGGGEGGGKLGLKLGILKPRGFLRGNLDKGLFAEMAHTDDPEAVTTNGLFGFFDGGEAVGGYGESRGESGREAGRGGLFGDFQSSLACQGADISLG